MTKFILIILFNCITFYTYSQGEFIVEIDRATGKYNKIDCPIPGIKWVYANHRTYDENKGSFIFQGGEIGPDHLYSINVNDGSVNSNPLFEYCIPYIYDNSSGNLYGLFFVQSASIHYLEIINSATGSHNRISQNTIPNLSICGGFYTFDELHHKFMIISGNEIFSIDAATGILNSTTTLKLLKGEVFVCASLVFDNSTSKLYGIVWDGFVTKKYFLVKVDPISGDVIKIGSGNSFLEQGGSSAIDKAHQQYLYLYGSQADGGWEIATLDLVTGDVVYNALIAKYTANDNFLSLEYDNKRGRLFCIHWETKIQYKVYLGKDTAICKGNTIELNAGNPGSTYIWNTGETTQKITVSDAGKYSVTISNCGFTASSNIKISEYPVSALDLGKDTTICDGCSIVLNAGNNFKDYKWQDGSNKSTFTVKNRGTYWVDVTDKYGCKYSDKIVIKDENEGKEIFVPNSFTPDGDNINDVFKVVAPPSFVNINIKIFNRWGALIFETNDVNEGWDGTYRNEKLAEGVYVYIITYSKVNNSSLILKKEGKITLLR